MEIYTIYKAKNIINGKIYIGFDSNWPKRKESHYYNHRSKRCPNYYFYNALKKYGWDNFIWEVIYQSKDGQHCLTHMEKFFIEEYRSFVGFTDCNGYNTTLGGQGTFGKKQSEKNKKEQSKRRSIKNSQSRWYNNGRENKFSSESPGKEWILGRLNQKPTTKGNKCFNDGEQQLLTKNPPVGWKLGMLPKRKNDDIKNNLLGS